MKITSQKIVDELHWIDGVVSPVWLFLFCLMLVSIYLIYSKNGWSSDIYKIIIIILATFSYPIYYFGFQLLPAFIGNIFYIGLVIYVLYSLWDKFPLVSFLLIPIIIWVSIATLYVGAKLLSFK